MPSRKRIFFSTSFVLLSLLIVRITVAQDIVVNGNVAFTVLEGTIFYAPGDFNFKGSQEAKVSGSLRIKGSLFHNGAGEFIDDQDGATVPAGAEVRFVGSGSQTLRHPQEEGYRLSTKISGRQKCWRSGFGMNVATHAGIRMDAGAGNNNQGDLNLGSFSVTLLSSLGNTPSVVGENPNRRIYGSFGSLILNGKTFQPGTHSPGNLGLTFTSNVAFGFTTLTRRYGDTSVVADGSMARSYIFTGATGQDLSNVQLQYDADEDLSGVPTSDIGVYSSSDGATWVPNNASAGGLVNGFATVNTSISGVSGTTYLALARRNCVENKPSFAIEVDVLSAKEGNPTELSVVNGQIDVCEQTEISLTVSEELESYEWSTSETGRRVELPPIAADASYAVLATSTRGCQATDTVFVDAKSNPVSDFTMEPNWPDRPELLICKDHAIAFDGANSYAADDSDIVSYRWIFDNQFVQSGDDFVRREGSEVIKGESQTTFTYGAENYYFPNLTVVSEFGCSSKGESEQTSAIRILDPPTLSFDIYASEEMDRALIKPIDLPDTCEQTTLFVESFVDFEDNIQQDFEKRPWDIAFVERPSPKYKNIIPREAKLSHSWDFGDGSPPKDPTEILDSGVLDGEASDRTRQNHRYSYDPNFGGQPGNLYTIALKAQPPADRHFECAITEVRDVRIYPRPDVSFELQVAGSTLTPVSDGGETYYEVCEGVNVDFINQSIIGEGVEGEIISYLWDFGDGKSSDEINPTHDYARETEEGTFYLITLWALSAYRCEEETTVKIRVYPAPQGSILFASDDSFGRKAICVGDQIEFEDHTSIPYGSISSREWSYGDGSTPLLPFESHSYDEPGVYAVALTRTSDQGCTNSSNALEVVVDPVPVADFDVDDVCDGEVIHFFSRSQAFGAQEVQYVWKVDGEMVAEDENPEISYDVTWNEGEDERVLPVVYTVTANPNTSACSAEKSEELVIHRKPEFDFGLPAITFAADTLLNPLELEEAFFPENSTFVWEDGSNVPQAMTALNVVASGTYRLTVTSPEDCSAMGVSQVYVLPPADLGIDRSLCAPGETISASPPISGPIVPNYTWYETSDLQEVLGTGPTIDITETGNYLVRITYTTGGTTKTTTDQVMIDIDQDIDISLPGLIVACSGEEVTLDAGFDVVDGSFLWKGPPAFTQATTRSITTSVPGAYVLEVRQGVCSDEALVEVEFLQRPSALFFSSNEGPCVGEEIVLQAANSGVVTWDFGDGTSAGGMEVKKTFDASGLYTVRMAVENSNGCTDFFERVITVHAVPTFDFSVLGSCQGEEVAFSSIDDPSSEISSYRWDFGDGIVDLAGPNVTHSYDGFGSFEVALTVESADGCEAKGTANVKINQKPRVNLPPQVLACEGVASLDPSDPTLTCLLAAVISGPIGTVYRWGPLGCSR